MQVAADFQHDGNYPLPDGFSVGLLLIVVQHGVGLEPVVFLLGLIPTISIGPSGLHLLLSPGVVIMLRELLDQRVQLVRELDSGNQDIKFS